MDVKCKELIYTPIDALSFKITGDTYALTPKLENNVIQSLEGCDGILFSLGLTVEIKRRKYKVNIIKEITSPKGNYYIISIDKRTKASIFLLPMLGGSRRLYLWNTLLLNCFIATEEDKDCIALLYRWSSDTLFLKFEKALSKFKSFKRRYDPTPNCVMFVFNVPKLQQRNYNKFIKGKYSKISSAYKIQLLEFHDKDIDDTIGQVLFKTDKRKESLEKKLGSPLPEDSELLSIIDVKEETYNSETYKFKKLL
tara:strand:- start:368 stop:1126 length:759 start_codon:yes stop_codon:yes gene_type:complete